MKYIRYIHEYGKELNLVNHQFVFALETRYPTNQPVYYATCDDSSDTSNVIELTESRFISDMKSEWIQRIKSIRFRIETGGINLNGAEIATTRESQAMITGAVTAAILDEEYELNWSTMTDDFITLNAQEVIGIGQVVRAHVQACFDNQKDLIAAVRQANTINDIKDINILSGWPSSNVS